MDRCVVIVKRHRFSNESYKGVFIWQYNEKNDIFVLYIILNENMYATSNRTDEVYRKAVSTHEFTHCVAALLTLSRLNIKVLIENQHKKLAKRFHAIEGSDIKNLMTDISNSMLNPGAEQFLFFPDSHFRTGDEDFPPKYSELYRKLLLSYELFREYFTNETIGEMKLLLDSGKRDEFADIIAERIKKISEEKRLDLNFVLQCFKNEFIKKLLKELN